MNYKQIKKVDEVLEAFSKISYFDLEEIKEAAEIFERDEYLVVNVDLIENQYRDYCEYFINPNGYVSDYQLKYNKLENILKQG